MKFLFFSLWYHPEPVFKPHSLARKLLERGHEVTVVTGFPNYPVGQIYPGYSLKPWSIETKDGVRIVRIFHFVDRSRSVFSRIFSYLSYALLAALAGIILSISFRPDIVWTYQIGLPAVLFNIFYRIPFVHEVQDLWPEWSFSTMQGMKKWLYHVLEVQEKYIYLRAKCIVTITDSFKERLVYKGCDGKKIWVIPNWADDDKFYPKNPDLDLADREGFRKRFCVMYVGNIGTAQNLETVVQAAHLLRNESEIEFVIIGDGVEREKLQQKVEQLGLTNFSFLGPRPQEQAADYLALADVVLIHLEKSPIYEITVPSKTYSYLAVGKPILAAVSGETARLLEGIGAGIVCDPGDPQILAQAVLRFFRLSEEERTKMGKRGREAFIKNYASNVLLGKYEELFKQALINNS